MKMRNLFLSFTALLSVVFTAGLHAQTTAFTYQGRLDDNAVPANGMYDFQFSQYDLPVGGALRAGPITNSAVQVSNGLFSVLVDFGSAAFSNRDHWLEIGVRTDSKADFEIMSPRQQITPTPLAISAYKVPAGAISSNMLADGAVTTAKLANAAVTGDQIANGSVENRALAEDAVGTAAIQDEAVTTSQLADAAVSSRKLASSITLGAGSTSGELTVWNGSNDQPGVELLGQNRRVLVYGTNGVPRSSLDASPGGRLLLNSASDITTIRLDADEGISSGKQIRLFNPFDDTTHMTLYRTAEGGIVSVQQTGAAGAAILHASSFGNSVQLTRDNGLPGSILGSSSLSIRQPDGDFGINATANDTGAILAVRNADGSDRVVIDGDDGNGAGQVRVLGDDGEVRAQLEVYSGAGTGGQLRLFSAINANETFISADGFSRINTFLGIGRNALGQVLEVEGTASKSVAGDWLANSDARIKTDVQSVNNALETIDHLRPVKFRYRPEYLEQHPRIRDTEYYNVIAQEFAAVFPDAVSESGDTLPNGDKVLQVDTHPAMITALAAIQELHALVKTQEQRIAELEEQLRADSTELNTTKIAQKGQ